MVEHWNAQLKQRLAALGGRYTDESIERIGASLNLASLLESKLYPTYMERSEIFLLCCLLLCFKLNVFQNHSGETTARRPALGHSEGDFWDQVTDGAAMAKVCCSLIYIFSVFSTHPSLMLFLNCP